MTLPDAGPVVGFDLDMTLVDSAAGIGAAFRAALVDLHGHDLPGGAALPTDADVRPWIGIPLERMVAALLPQVDPAAAAARYRELYALHGVPLTRLLPGAREALGAVRAAGGRILVVSAKAERGVRAVLAHVGLDTGPLAPDVVAGGLFAAAKGEVLRAERAGVYVGDHPADVEAARAAGATAVAVATGPVPAAGLVAAGADVVLTDLHGFPPWLAGWTPAGVAARASGADRGGSG